MSKTLKNVFDRSGGMGVVYAPCSNRVCSGQRIYPVLCVLTILFYLPFGHLVWFQICLSCDFPHCVPLPPSLLLPPRVFRPGWAAAVVMGAMAVVVVVVVVVVFTVDKWRTRRVTFRVLRSDRLLFRLEKLRVCHIMNYTIIASDDVHRWNRSRNG